jgi:protein TonB
MPVSSHRSPSHRLPLDEVEPADTGGRMLGWAIYASIVLVGFVFGVVVGNMRPKTIEIVKTVPVEIKPEAKPAERKEPEKKEPEKKEVEKKNPPVIKTPDPMTPEPKAEPKPEPKAEPKVEPKKSPEAKAPEVLFAKEIFPIMKSKCMICHGDTKGVKGGLDMKTLAAIKKGGDNGDALVPGDLKKSLIWTTIEDGAMPPPEKPQLTDKEKTLIKNWILSGGK